MNWSTRPVRPDDADQVAAHGHHGERDDAKRVLYAAWARPRIAAGTYLGWFACDDCGVIAGAGAVLLDWGPTRANPCGQMARIVNVYTEPGWRRRGIARALLATVMTACEARDVREFNLGATTEARGLYAALGFESYPAEMRRRVNAAR